MKIFKILGVLLIAAGALALAYGGFTYTDGSKGVKVGKLELGYKTKERVEIPTWAGVAAIVGGTVLLLAPPRKRRRR